MSAWWIPKHLISKCLSSSSFCDSLPEFVGDSSDFLHWALCLWTKHGLTILCMKQSNSRSSGNSLICTLQKKPRSFIQQGKPYLFLQSNSNGNADLLPPKKAKVLQSTGNKISLFCFDANGILLVDSLQNGHTVTGWYYATLCFLWTNLTLSKKVSIKEVIKINLTPKVSSELIKRENLHQAWAGNWWRKGWTLWVHHLV